MKEIFIDEDKNFTKIYLIEDYKIIEKHNENKKSPMIEGNIYVGKVQNVLPGMQAAFVRIGNTKNAFIHLKDILPKEDVTKLEKNELKTDIKNIIKPGDEILVQVTRDENYKKGARVTCHISFSKRFFVYMPETPFITISQKIENKDTRNELLNFFKENLPKEIGGVIRTSAENANKKEMLEEINTLNNLWENIKSKEITMAPQELYNAGGIIKKYIIDNIDKGLERIIVRNQDLKSNVLNILEEENIKLPIEINIDEDYLNKFDYENQIKKSENRKIWLDCGGFITIDKTEALTAIDVNTGKFIGKDDFEKTVFEVNKEATIEIAKQLKLRDIGGIIIIDYIDMHIEQNKQRILKIFEEELKKDSSKVQIEGFTKLNLLELTRKHVYTI